MPFASASPIQSSLAEATGLASSTVATPASAAHSVETSSTGYKLHYATPSTHSEVASRMVEQAIEQDEAAHQDAELAAALASLKDMLGKIEESPASSSDTVRSLWSLEGADIVEPPTLAEIDTLVAKSDGRSFANLGQTEC